MNDNTMKFVVPEDSSEEMKTILTAVYGALSEKGYNPINQIVGYLLSEDPTYITNYNNARSLICKLDRDELLQELVKHYLFSQGKRQDLPVRLSRAGLLHAKTAGIRLSCRIPADFFCFLFTAGPCRT